MTYYYYVDEDTGEGFVIGAYSPSEAGSYAIDVCDNPVYYGEVPEEWVVSRGFDVY